MILKAVIFGWIGGFITAYLFDPSLGVFLGIMFGYLIGVFTSIAALFIR